MFVYCIPPIRNVHSVCNLVQLCFICTSSYMFSRITESHSCMYVSFRISESYAFIKMICFIMTPIYFTSLLMLTFNSLNLGFIHFALPPPPLAMQASFLFSRSRSKNKLCILDQGGHLVNLSKSQNIHSCP